MANAKVALLRYVRTARGWRRVRVEAIRKGRGWDERLALPGGAEILERGEFQLRWYHGARAIYNFCAKCSPKLGRVDVIRVLLYFTDMSMDKIAAWSGIAGDGRPVQSPVVGACKECFVALDSKFK